MSREVMNSIVAKFLKETPRQAIGRVVGKPRSLRFRLARDTLGVMAIQDLAMGLGFVVKAVAVIALRQDAR